MKTSNLSLTFNTATACISTQPLSAFSHSRSGLTRGNYTFDPHRLDGKSGQTAVCEPLTAMASPPNEEPHSSAAPRGFTMPQGTNFKLFNKLKLFFRVVFRFCLLTLFNMGISYNVYMWTGGYKFNLIYNVYIREVARPFISDYNIVRHVSFYSNIVLCLACLYIFIRSRGFSAIKDSLRRYFYFYLLILFQQFFLSSALFDHGTLTHIHEDDDGFVMMFAYIFSVIVSIGYGLAFSILMEAKK